MRKITIVGIILALLFIASCKQQPKIPSAEEQLLAKGIPPYTIQLLRLATECKCEMDDTNRIFCTCSKKEWKEDLRFICRKPPVDIYEAVSNCDSARVDKK